MNLANGGADPNAPNPPEGIMGNQDSRNTAGANQIWFMNGTAVSSVSVIASLADTAFEVKGVADFNGDSKADILWRSYVSGSNYVWRMNGAALVLSVELPALADTAWDIKAADDFDGDGKADIMWRNYGSGGNYIWLMNEAALITHGALASVPDLNFTVVGR